MIVPKKAFKETITIEALSLDIMTEWEQLVKECNQCKRCVLSNNRNNIVIGRGNHCAPLVFVGEGPGEQEDLTGIPFVGPAGKLLNLLIKAMNIDEESYYISNIVKCRPPGNRVPFEEEANMCLYYLRKQIMLIKPKIIVCLGSTAMKYIIDKDSKITNIRGNWIKKKDLWIMPTFHPAALLRDKSKKILMWQDMKKVKLKLDELLHNDLENLKYKEEQA